MNLLHYFNVTCIWTHSIPKIKLKLKDELKITKEIPIKCIKGHRKIPMSSSQVDYFIHYLGSELGEKIFDIRKKLFSKTKLIEWYILNHNLSHTEIELLLAYKQSICDKLSNSINNFYSSNASIDVRKKYQIRSEKWKDIIGKQNSDRWKDKEYSDQQIKNRRESGAYIKSAIKNKANMADPAFKEKFMVSMKSNERCEKISKKAKKM